MNQYRIEGRSRRDALRRGLGALTGVALIGFVGTGARAAESKLAKSAVQYVDAGRIPDKDCDDCTQFIPGKTAKAMGSCKIVEGEINPHGHCIAFSPKARK